MSGRHHEFTITKPFGANNSDINRIYTDSNFPPSSKQVYWVKIWIIYLQQIQLPVPIQCQEIMQMPPYFCRSKQFSTYRLSCRHHYRVIWRLWVLHYNDVMMCAMASQITSLTYVYSSVYSGADKKKHQSSASLAFVRGIHRWPVNSLHKGPVTWKMFPFDDVIMKWVDTIRGKPSIVRLHPTHIKLIGFDVLIGPA